MTRWKREWYNYLVRAGHYERKRSAMCWGLNNARARLDDWVEARRWSRTMHRTYMSAAREARISCSLRLP